MYFQSMSLSVGLEGRAAIEAIDACDRLAPKLLELIAQHDHAASVARPDWTGPHHDTFEERFTSVRGALTDGEAWVVRKRRELQVALLNSMADSS